MQRGVTLTPDGAHFAIHSRDAERLWLCLFEGDTETRHEMTREGDLHHTNVAGVKEGQCYGYRAEGLYAPDEQLFFDPTKLLVDPYATVLDRPFMWDARLAAYGEDTAKLVPKAVITAPLPPLPHAPPRFTEGGLIYELNVRGFTMLHPDMPSALRGTIAALAHPSIIAHLQKIGVSAIELMPIVAWIDERHLAPLRLHNAWGYNPVVPMALDPRLCPGGIEELRATVTALHTAGIGVILDLVFNHSGESDLGGPTLSFRGLDNRNYYTHEADGTLANVTGCGNTFNCAQPVVRDLILDSLRHFVSQAGVDGFRFDLAPVLAREPGFNRHAPLFAAIAVDPLLRDRVMIAEPWDIGMGGYQLGNFPANWLEWNDRYRDDVRRFWRGDGSASALATRLCGSADVFGETRTRTVNFLAAHDGFTLADLVSYEERHNLANGEDNRDGHGENLSWNNGREGASQDADVLARRTTDLRALLTTLFASRGTIMLTAGDEFGRSQQGNNNAYAQDNELSWIDWGGRNVALEDFVASLAHWRTAHLAIYDPTLRHDLHWLALDGTPLSGARWEDPALPGFICEVPNVQGDPIAVRIDRTARRCTLTPAPASATPAAGRAPMHADDFTIPRDGHTIFVRRWAPDSAPRAIVMIAHGLTEHGGRYARLAESLTQAGYLVTAHDHRGHGPHCLAQDLGHFADRDGWRACLDDLHALAAKLRGDYPALPLIFMGHSMGSFMGQTFIAEASDILTGAILSGTSGPPPAILPFGRLVVAFERWRCGPRGKSPLLQQLLFGAQNDHFKPTRTTADWLSRDPVEVDRYVADSLCGFPVTTQLATDLTTALSQLGLRAIAARIRKDLPIYIFSGERDPVGAKLGQLINNYKAAGLGVSTKIYPDGRHEMVNDINRDEVTADLIAWLDKALNI